MGSEMCIRDSTYIDDSARMSLLTGVTDGGVNQVLNFGTGRDVSINYLADLVLTRLNLSGKVNIRHVDYDHRRTREIEVFNRVANVDKAEKLLKYRPLTVLSDGLDKYITWYKGGA